jgi:hypothetical protein
MWHFSGENEGTKITFVRMTTLCQYSSTKTALFVNAKPRRHTIGFNSDNAMRLCTNGSTS